MKRIEGNNIWETDDCQNCDNWMLRTSKFPAKQALPPGKTPPDRMLDAVTLEYSDLMSACSKTYTKVFAGEWNKGQARAFLQAWCINTTITEQIIDSAQNCHAYEHALAQRDEEMIAAIEEEKNEEPQKFKPWEPPALWKSGLSIHQSFEVPMHLLFLGLVGTTVLVISEWTTIRKQQAFLQRELETLTMKIEKKHLSWCRVSAYRGKKLGGGGSLMLTLDSRVYFLGCTRFLIGKNSKMLNLMFFLTNHKKNG